MRVGLFFLRHVHTYVRTYTYTYTYVQNALELSRCSHLRIFRIGINLLLRECCDKTAPIKAITTITQPVDY